MCFEQFFREQLAGLCREYGLKTMKWAERIYALIGPDYIIWFVGEITENMELHYIRRDHDGKIKRWNVDWYIGTAIEDQDRTGLVDQRSIVDGWKNDVILVARVLKRRFRDLLSGGDRWMEGYFKSKYAFAPRELFGDDLKKAEQYI